MIVAAMIPFLVEMKAIRDETETGTAWADGEFDPPTICLNIGINDHTKIKLLCCESPVSYNKPNVRMKCFHPHSMLPPAADNRRLVLKLSSRSIDW